MLTVMRVRWDSVDEAQWSITRTVLNTRALAPYGCVSWHTRRAGETVRATALWDSHHAARLFVIGRLREAIAAARLDQPEIRQDPVPGVHYIGRRPALAAATVTPAALQPVVEEREAA